MGFIGYNASGYAELAAEIRTRKSNLLNILDSFADVDTAIANCWKGEDADAYREELKKVISSTINSVTEAYDALSSQCNQTYNDWIAKQSTGQN